MATDQVAGSSPYLVIAQIRFCSDQVRTKIAGLVSVQDRNKIVGLVSDQVGIRTARLVSDQFRFRG